MKNQAKAQRWEHIWYEPMAPSSNVLDFPILVSSFPWKYRLLQVTSKTPVPVLAMTQWNFPNWVDWESGQRWWWLPSVECCCPWREGCLHTPAPLQPPKAPLLVGCSDVAVLQFWPSFEQGLHIFILHWLLQIMLLVLLKDIVFSVLCHLSSWLNERAVFILRLHIRKPRFNEFKQLGSGPTANQWHNQDSKPGLPGSRAQVLAHPVGMGNPDFKINIWVRDWERMTGIQKLLSSKAANV